MERGQARRQTHGRVGAQMHTRTDERAKIGERHERGKNGERQGPMDTGYGRTDTGAGCRGRDGWVQRQGRMGAEAGTDGHGARKDGHGRRVKRQGRMGARAQWHERMDMRALERGTDGWTRAHGSTDARMHTREHGHTRVHGNTGARMHTREHGHTHGRTGARAHGRTNAHGHTATRMHTC